MLRQSKTDLSATHSFQTFISVFISLVYTSYALAYTSWRDVLKFFVTLSISSITGQFEKKKKKYEDIDTDTAFHAISRHIIAQNSTHISIKRGSY